MSTNKTIVPNDFHKIHPPQTLHWLCCSGWNLQPHAQAHLNLAQQRIDTDLHLRYRNERSCQQAGHGPQSRVIWCAGKQRKFGLVAAEWHKFSFFQNLVLLQIPRLILKSYTGM